MTLIVDLQKKVEYKEDKPPFPQSRKVPKILKPPETATQLRNIGGFGLGGADIIEPISKREKKRKGKSIFIIRGLTGRKAEKIYMNHHRETGEPVFGELLDTRDHGCGYDFEISNTLQNVQVEVKGLDGDTGGIVFTSKEWDVARKNGDSYFLIIVRNVFEKPSIQIIQNPASVLSPKKSIFTTVQVRWNVTDSEIPRI